MLKKRPILFFINKDNSTFLKNSYNIYSTFSLFKKYNLDKNFYFMFYYSDFYLLDFNFLIDCKSNNFKTVKFIENNKFFFLFFYYNNKFYTYDLLLKFIKLFLFKFNKFLYYLNFNNINKKILYLLLYFKKKGCLV